MNRNICRSEKKYCLYLFVYIYVEYMIIIFMCMQYIQNVMNYIVYFVLFVIFYWDIYIVRCLYLFVWLDCVLLYCCMFDL